jgi:hypothetical protein
MKNVFRLIFLIVIILVLLGGMIGCKSSASSTFDANAVRAYADTATEATLLGLSENNLAEYIQNGNAQFKAAVTQENFDKIANQLANQLGTYVSKEFLSTEEIQGYIVVHYKATYTKGSVGVRMAFDNDHLVAGQYFE